MVHSLFLQLTDKSEKFSLDWIKVAQSMGYKFDVDLNSPPFHDKKISYVQNTIWNGKRVSTADAFLENGKQYERKNFHILANSLATKIVFDDNKRAIGVRFDRNGKTYSANASKEVIISCGAIESPKLLQLSGVGPKEFLESKGIKVISDVPAGDNFMTHVVYNIIMVSLF